MYGNYGGNPYANNNMNDIFNQFFGGNFGEI